MKKITYTILALLTLACLGVIIELILWGKIKKNEKRLSKSEEKFFYKPQELKKTFFKSIEKKKM